MNACLRIHIWEARKYCLGKDKFGGALSLTGAIKDVEIVRARYRSRNFLSALCVN